MKNDYEIHGDVTAIILNSRKYGRMKTLISTTKLEIADSYPNTWFVTYQPEVKGFYVVGTLQRNKKKHTILLHRLITNCPDHLQVDHINHNTLDNRDENLRIVTDGQNKQNKNGAYCNSKSGIRGVSWSKREGKWKAQIRVNFKDIHLGYFDDVEQAKVAVEIARKLLMPFSNMDRKSG